VKQAHASKPLFRQRRSRALRITCALVLILLAASDPLTARAQPTARESDVKATLLFNFCEFVEWPASALSDTNAPFVIGLLGTDPFGKFLDELVKNERAHGKPIHIRRFRKAEDAIDAHILFVSKSEQPRVPSILSVLKGRPVLTVGETGEPGFTRQGGMVALLTEKDNIRIRINLEQVRSARLNLSAKLLRLAEIVPNQKH
jgi:hypothetical protein